MLCVFVLLHSTIIAPLVTTSLASPDAAASGVYLSVVVAGRADDYGGRFVDRLQVFLSQWAPNDARAINDWLELIVVEWNPPAGTSLSKLLCPGGALDEGRQAPPFCRILRILQVAAEIHEKLPFMSRAELLEFWAKNVCTVLSFNK